ncbi:MAG: alpha-L-fucosidase [Bacteroidetes bacterium HGW-Bacteroidetes-6]|nr:MAG: alpha-L-fucosidase [Bacteroidetes bacterium HGW-Bacteroidetes-6]
MTGMLKTSLALLLFLLISGLYGQKNTNDGYIPPADPLAQQKLEQWRDLKFGIIMHWGLYSQLGVVESWGLCSEDQGFQDRGGINYTDYKNMYFGQIAKFNPTSFCPEKWADAAWNAGMRYVIFTTKHHDGFCMFDTKQTDFRITSEQCPFHINPKANVTKYIFDAFRTKGFMTGAYFSKPDWHSPLYWTPLLATPDRNCNYDVKKYPDRWKDYQNYTFNQIQELTTGYGRLDILWLDGGWVRPDSTINDEVRSWGYTIPAWEQDINIPRIATMARQNQPGILIVDRTVHGPYEDYRTPEQSVPDSILPYPFETCMTMTANWGYIRNAEYKPAESIIQTLIDVVSKGGNLLLNVAPTPEGTFEDTALARLNEIGRWMAINGEAIYSSRPWITFKQGDNIRFTRSKDSTYLYVFAFDRPDNILPLPASGLKRPCKVTLLGSDLHIKSEIREGVFTLIIPESLLKDCRYPTKFIPVFRISLR